MGAGWLVKLGWNRRLQPGIAMRTPRSGDWAAASRHDASNTLPPCARSQGVARKTRRIARCHRCIGTESPVRQRSRSKAGSTSGRRAAASRPPLQRAARKGGRVRAPALVDFRPAERLLITAAIPGETSSLGMGTDDLSEAANALAIVHDAPITPGLTVHTAQDELQTAYRWVSALRVAGEKRYVRLRELVAGLGDLVTTLDEQGVVLIHRDFFAAQLPRQRNTLWVVDLDTLSVGHPELDVATFLAHLFLDGLTAGVAPDEITEAAGRFVEAYRRSGGRVANYRLRFYLPCALARLGAIHAARDVPAEIVDELWRMAESHLADFRPWG